MPILKTITVRSFKSIVEQTIDLGQLNVFIGLNGSGKSNFLEAIGMLSAATTGEITYSKLADRGVRLSSPEVFRSAFANVNRKITFFLEAVFDEFLYHANITSQAETQGRYSWRYHAEKLSRGKSHNKKVAGRSNSFSGIPTVSGFKKEMLRPHQSIILTAESLGAFSEEEIEDIEALRNFAIYAPSTPILRGVAIDESKKGPLGLYGGGLANALLDVLRGDEKDAVRQLSDFFQLLEWFQMFTVRQPDSSLQSSHIHTGRNVLAFRDRYMSRTFKELYAYDVSEGALYIVFVLLLLVHKHAPNIFALDNVDSALNPGLVTNLIAHVATALEANPNKQIFMTTHNPTTLDGIDLFNPNHRLYVVKRSKEGYTNFERIAPPEGATRKEWRQKYGLMKLSEIWLSGAIEGIAPPAGF